MTTKSNLAGMASGCPARRPRIWLKVLVLVAVAGWGFIAGQIAQKRRCETAIQEEGQRRFQEFLGIAIDLGIITVDRQKLDEIICVREESEWEDRDATQRGEGDQP